MFPRLWQDKWLQHVLSKGGQGAVAHQILGAGGIGRQLGTEVELRLRFRVLLETSQDPKIWPDMLKQHETPEIVWIIGGHKSSSIEGCVLEPPFIYLSCLSYAIPSYQIETNRIKRKLNYLANHLYLKNAIVIGTIESIDTCRSDTIDTIDWYVDDGWVYWTNGPMDWRMYVWVDKSMHGWVHVWMDDRCMDWWLDG